jgi:hypothetical protein
MTEEISPLLEVLSDQMVSKTHTILVQPFMFGQYRIQLTRVDRPDPFAPAGHGSIVREMCTYNPRTVATLALFLRLAADPEAYCRELERPWNCESSGGRIRLDNRQPFVCPDCAAESFNINDKANRYCVRCHKFFDW